MDDLSKELTTNSITDGKHEIVSSLIDYFRIKKSEGYYENYETFMSKACEYYKDINDLIQDFLDPLERLFFAQDYHKPLLIDYQLFEKIYLDFLKQDSNETKNLDFKEELESFLTKTSEFLNLIKETKGKKGMNFYLTLEKIFEDNKRIKEIVLNAKEDEISRLNKNRSYENVLKLLTKIYSNDKS